MVITHFFQSRISHRFLNNVSFSSYLKYSDDKMSLALWPYFLVIQREWAQRLEILSQESRGDEIIALKL